MNKIIFIANVDTGDGMSGGTRIYVELLRKWQNYASIYFFGSVGTIKKLHEENIKKFNYIETDTNDEVVLDSILSIFRHFLRRLFFGIRTLMRNKEIVKESDFIYSVSDFYPDLLSAFYAKLNNKNLKWIAGYYLFAPSPFAQDSPYKGKDWLRGFLYWLMQKPSYWLVKMFADYVFVTSEPDVEKFVTKKRKRSRIIVVQGGVDISESEKYLQSPDIIKKDGRKYDACFVGRFHYQKGVLELIDIWKRVCDLRGDSKLAIIGNGSLENEIQKKIKEYGLEKHIDLLGYCDGLKKYEIFKQSKLMVHPATYDSGGMAAAEGMAWGLPGVSFDLIALKTYYPKGMIKTKLNDNGEFAKNIIKLLTDEDLYIKTSNDARNLIIEVWDWNRRAEKIFNSLEIKQ